MGINLKISTAILAVLFIAAGTVSAQEKKQVEKKVITVVTVDENGVKRDTTISTTDTLDFEGENIFITTKDGKAMHGMEQGDNVMIWTARPGEPGMPGQMKMRHMRMMSDDREPMEGVSYHITIDGVTVNIRAPKEKVKEADLILEEVRQILLKK